MNSDFDQSKPRQIWLLFGTIPIVFVTGFLSAYFFLRVTGKESVAKNTPTYALTVEASPTPTPFLFEDMTIPHLRSKEFEGKISGMQKVSENESYTSYVATYDSDGFKVNGLLTKPKTAKPVGGFPAIVFVHGYIRPENYKTLVNYVSWVDNFARNGFVVFKIDLRGHGTSEGEPGGAYYSSDYVVDTLNAYSSVQELDFVNPKKIGLFGHSMAGNIVSRTFSVLQKVPAVVIFAGAGYTYSDLVEYDIADKTYVPPAPDSIPAKKRMLLRDTYGDFIPESWFWKQVPATNYLGDVRGAIQIHHAVDDPVVSIDYSRNLIKILDATEIAHELIEYPSGGHNLTGVSFTQAMQKSTDFFKKNFEK